MRVTDGEGADMRGTPPGREQDAGERPPVGRWDALWLLLFLLALGLSIWKLPKGIAIPDEAFYLSVPYRLLQGDRLLIHEWHVSQISSLLLLPLLRLYLRLFGTAEGILLAFRAIFLFFHALTAAYLFLRLRRRSPAGAVFASLLYLVYVPMNIMALSYNSMGIGLLAIVFVTAALTGGRPRDAVLCGLCFAGAVLCNPYYFILYPIYTCAAGFAALRRRADFSCLRGRFWLILTLTGAAAAGLVCLRLFLGADPALLAQTLPMILYGDVAEHPARSLPGILYGVWASFHKNRLFVPTLALSITLCLCRAADRKWRDHRALYLAAAACLSACYGLWFRVYTPVSLNYYMFPLSILGFFAWLFSDRRRDPLFWFVYFPGVLCWFCSAAASNLGFLNIASLSALNMLASLVFIADAVRELFSRARWWRAAAALMLLAVAVQAGLLAECRFCTVFSMDPVSALTETIDRGALRGLQALPGEAAAHERAWDSAGAARQAPGDVVAYLSDVSGLYLDDVKRCGVFSPWFPGVSAAENLPRLKRYWALFPDRVPDCILICMDDPRAEALLLDGLRDLGYVQRPLDRGFLLSPPDRA